jgi:hypothetical protein
MACRTPLLALAVIRPIGLPNVRDWWLAAVPTRTATPEVSHQFGTAGGYRQDSKSNRKAITPNGKRKRTQSVGYKTTCLDSGEPHVAYKR